MKRVAEDIPTQSTKLQVLEAGEAMNAEDEPTVTYGPEALSVATRGTGYYQMKVPTGDVPPMQVGYGPRQLVMREPVGPPPRTYVYRGYEYPGQYNPGVFSVDLKDTTHVEFPSVAARVKTTALNSVEAIYPNLNARHKQMLQTRIQSAIKGKGKKRDTRTLTAVSALAIALKAEDMAFSEGIQRLKRFRTDIKYQKHALTGHRKRSAAEKAITYLNRYQKPRVNADSGRVRAGARRATAVQTEMLRAAAAE